MKGSEVQGSAQQLAAEAAILIEKETPGCGVSYERSGFSGLTQFRTATQLTLNGEP